jgi:hypothetical protein
MAAPGEQSDRRLQPEYDEGGQSSDGMFVMRELWAPLTRLAFTAVAEAASAQPTFSSVTGFDPTLLAGKTCQGSFDTGAGRAESEGALQLRFAVNGAMLTANVWRRFGSDAQNRAAYAITQPGPPFGVGGFQNLGPVRDLTVTNNIIQYVDGPGDRVVLYCDAGWLWGQSDPRGAHNPYMTLTANVTMRCY